MENWKQKPSNGGRKPNADYRGEMKNQVQNMEEIINVQKEFKPYWITTGIDKNLIDFAEKVGKYLAQKRMTTSKIRSIYSEIKRIQMNFDEEKAAFYLLKPKVAYAYGRDKSIGKFKDVFDECYKYIEDNKTHYENFCKIMEAIVAYHKANGGKDN